MVDSEKRYFVITPGRTGSSFLCACLADAGADFGMAVPDNWGQDEATMELPIIRQAAAAWQKGVSSRNGYRRSRQRKTAVRLLRRALKATSFFKDGNLDLLTTPIQLAGYTPITILNIRQFGPTVAGMLRLWMDDFSQAEELYIRTIQNGITMIWRYGGCVVDHADLMDPSQTGWAHEIAAVTGIDEIVVLRARAERLDTGRPQQPPFPIGSNRAEDIYAVARSLCLMPRIQ